MDYHNNAFGIDLSHRDLSTQELKSIVLISNDVIRYPGEALWWDLGINLLLNINAYLTVIKELLRLLDVLYKNIF